MKQKFIIGSVIAIVVIIGSAILYWNQLRGVWPALLQPEQDIVRLIEESVPTPTVKLDRPATTTPTKPTQPARQTQQGPLRMPEGFSLSIFAKDLGAPRVMIFDSVGTVLVSIPSRGEVLALPDANDDGAAEDPIVVARGLDRPHGLELLCNRTECTLFIAEEAKVAAYAYDTHTKKATWTKDLATLPTGGNHTSRSLLLYEGNLLISAGSSCNVCLERGQDRANIRQIDLISGEVKTFATGLRNAVFMAIHPDSGDIWATEMGRDLLGDDTPPDELNIVKRGANYGWPTCYGKNIHDTEFDKSTYIRNPCMEPFEQPSHIDIPAHSAPLGLAFIPDSWPVAYHDDLLVAYHGSWNRSVPTGYKIVRYRLNEDGVYEGRDDFISGWLVLNNTEGLIKENTALGRPVGIIIRSDGTAYISDDKAGVIYRLVPPKNT